MEIRRGACVKPRASRRVLRHAPRGESTVAGFWARNLILFLLSMKWACLVSSQQQSITRKIKFFTQKLCLLPPMVFRFPGTYISAHRHFRAWRLIIILIIVCFLNISSIKLNVGGGGNGRKSFCSPSIWRDNEILPRKGRISLLWYIFFFSLPILGSICRF